MPGRILNTSAPLNDRNVMVKDYYGCVLAGFHQYGEVTWTTFFHWLSVLFVSTDSWIIVRGDRYASEEYLPSSAIVMPGRYILLATDGSPLHMNLTASSSRRRPLTPTRTRDGGPNTDRAIDRDGKCMIYGQIFGRSRPQAAHIFSRAHPQEWDTKGYASLVTDTASTHMVGGLSKIGSVQNVLLMSAELHLPWADYEFGIDPDDEYRVTAFVPGLDRITGRALQLDHISDPTTRPLDQLLQDHFMQGLLKHVKGSGERLWNHSQTFGTGAFDLSDDVVWGTEEGKERLELELENRLFEHRLQQNMDAPVALAL